MLSGLDSLVTADLLSVKPKNVYLDQKNFTGTIREVCVSSGAVSVSVSTVTDIRVLSCLYLQDLTLPYSEYSSVSADELMERGLEPARCRTTH